MPMDVSSSRPSNKANIFLGLIEYELNSLRGANTHICRIKGCGGAGCPPTNNFRKT